MIEEVYIRKAKPEDAENLIFLMNEVAGETDFLTFSQGSISTTPDQEKNDIDKVSQSLNSVMFVAELKGQLIGMLDFRAPIDDRARHCGEFSMFVKKEFWDKGIGKKLVSRLLSWVEQSNVIRKINLRVRKDNIRAISFFICIGFNCEGSILKAICIDNTFYDLLCMGMDIDIDKIDS